MTYVTRFVGTFFGAVVCVVGLMLLGLVVLRMAAPWLALPVSQVLQAVDAVVEPPTMTVAEARQNTTGEVTVVGDLYRVVGHPARICERVVQRDAAPRCTGASLVVKGLRNAAGIDLELREPAPWVERGTELMQEDVEIYGFMDEDILRVPPGGA